ncbi:hypothetical protein CASFOL_009484 [Castilleja foliolosa]|uniref:C2 domain-containing protein n=1 Tax=Castilleja foliolosa TaxID=1961234 RepID=A0ABD3DXH0_9LAMI
MCLQPSIHSPPNAACHHPFATKRRHDCKHHNKSSPIPRTPVWNEAFQDPLSSPSPCFSGEFEVKGNDVFGAVLIGVATMSTKKIWNRGWSTRSPPPPTSRRHRP